MTSQPYSKTAVPDRFPKTIGPYAIRERIGRGAMGVVYRAVDERTKTEIALKVMASDLDGDPETRERFFREAHVAGKLRHRNIVTVLDSGDDGGRLYIAMELLTGVTLAESLKDSSALDLENGIDVMIQVCQGLNIAHMAGVYHRDLKPANLFMCDDRSLKILDFGVARLVGSNMTVTGNIIGTPDFMSPEQVRGQEIDGRSDIFSVGSVFYLLLTGRKPFAANDLPAVLSKVVRAQPLPIRADEAPEPIAAVIRKAMSKDPAARQQDVGELVCELMAAAVEVEAATRQTAIRLRAMAEEMIHLTKRRTQLSAALEVPRGEQDPWLAIREQYPILQAGPNVLGTFPLRSAVVKELDRVVRAELESLRPLVSALEEGYVKFGAGKALQSDGALDRATAEYAAASRAAPSSPVIARAIAACGKAVDEQLEREARLEARLTVANEAAGRSNWTALLAIVKEIEEVDRDNPTAARLRVLAMRSLESERPRRPREPLERNTTATAPLPVLRTGTEDAGPPGDAEISSAAGVTGTIDEVPGDRTTPRTERIARGTRLNEEALRNFTAGDLVAAERLASQSVSLNAEDKETRHLLERMRAAITLRGKQDEKWRRVTKLLQRANALADDKNFVEALTVVDEAVLVDASNVTATALRARLVAERSAHQAERDREAARQRRLRASAPSLRQAQRAFKDGDLERARWSAENALAMTPDSSEALALLAQIAAATPEPSPDDTVKLDDPQSDTVSLAPWRSSVQERVTDLRGQASTWIRRWRSPEGKTKDR